MLITFLQMRHEHKEIDLKDLYFFQPELFNLHVKQFELNTKNTA